VVDDQRFVHLSSWVVDGLAAAVVAAWRAGESTVGLQRVVEALERGTARYRDTRGERLRWPGDVVEPATHRWRVETTGALREAVWLAGIKLRARSFDGAPAWSPEVQPVLRQALAIAYEHTSVRFLSQLTLLQHLVGPGTRLLEPRREFLLSRDSEPASVAYDHLTMLDLLARRPQWPVYPSAVWVPASRLVAPRWRGPLEFAFYREAIRQAVRFGCAEATQIHLIMAICSAEWLLEVTHNGFSPRIAATNRAGALLNEREVWHLSLLPEATTGRPVYPVADKRLHATAGAARRFRHRFVGTSHMLHAIVSDTGGPGSEALRSLGVDVDELRTRLSLELSPP
jgi:hypothetical protein